MEILVKEALCVLVEDVLSISEVGKCVLPVISSLLSSVLISLFQTESPNVFVLSFREM